MLLFTKAARGLSYRVIGPLAQEFTNQFSKKEDQKNEWENIIPLMEPGSMDFSRGGIEFRTIYRLEGAPPAEVPIKPTKPK
jgi:hypothetical protein